LHLESDFYTFLEDRLSRRLKEGTHRELLRRVIRWYREGGSKQVTKELRDQIILILGGLSLDVE
jgi:hypothetical protein